MNNLIISEIIEKKKPLFFISPHFDDAVLSAGALLDYLSKKTSVTVVNVFTKSEEGATLSAKQFLRQCGYQNAITLCNDREKEDAIVLETISDMVINLGHTDALWRKKYHKDILAYLFPFLPEAQAIYPTYRFHVSNGRISKEDATLMHHITQELKKIITDKDAVVFCPIGIGGHVDHLITRKVCEGLDRSLLYWSDFPYNKKISDVAIKETFSFDKHLERKEALVKGYKTQFQAMFPNGFIKEPEVFFYGKK